MPEILSSVQGRRIVLALTGLPVIATPSPGVWNVTRIDGSTVTPVRGAINRPPTTSSSAVVVDREAPLNRPVRYQLTLRLANGSSPYYLSLWRTIVAPLPVASDPITGVDADVTIVDWPQEDRESSGSAFVVPGRRDPVVVTGPLSVADSQVVLRTTTLVEARDLDALLQTGAAIHLRSACSGVEDRYLYVAKVSKARRSRNSSDAVRIWTLDVTETVMPTPNVAAIGDTLADLRAANSTRTLAQFATLYPTLLDVGRANFRGES